MTENDIKVGVEYAYSLEKEIAFIPYMIPMLD